MIISYPNRIFAIRAKAALDARQDFEVSIVGAWRFRMLSKEIKYWATTKKSTRNDDGPVKSPSLIFNIFNVKLVSFHWYALSAGYKMQSTIREDEILLKYFLV